MQFCNLQVAKSDTCGQPVVCASSTVELSRPYASRACTTTSIWHALSKPQAAALEETLHTVMPAAIASDDPALTTLIDPGAVSHVAHLALVLPTLLAKASESLVAGPTLAHGRNQFHRENIDLLALMVLAQMLYSLCDLLCPAMDLLIRLRRSPVVNEILGALDQALFVPLVAVGRLPLATAHVAELRLADTGHMVATGPQLNDSATAVAPLPLVSVSGTHQDVHGLVPGTRPRMPSVLALGACRAVPLLWTWSSSAHIMRGRDEGRASRDVTVRAVLRLELLTLLSEHALAALAE